MVQICKKKTVIFPQFLTFDVHFVRQGHHKIWKSQFYRSFWRSTSISCEKGHHKIWKSQFYRSFWRSTSISCERVTTKFENRNFTAVFDVRRPFRAKGLPQNLKIAILPQFLTFDVHFVRKGHHKIWKSQFYRSFWRSTSISCERVTTKFENRNFTAVFDVRRPFRAKRSPQNLKIAILPQFLTFDVHFVRKGHHKIWKSQFYRSFWRSTSISCERVEMDTSKSQFYRSFWRSTSISCQRVAFRGGPAAPPPP